jgi:nucleotide-binding universal stress UspA family protein
LAWAFPLSKERLHIGETPLKILLAIDGSKCSEDTATAIAQQLRPDGAEVRVLHVSEPTWLAVDYELGQVQEIQAAREEGLKRGKEIVESIKPLLAQAGFAVTTAFEEGDPRFAITEYAAQWNADLLVVGSHGRRGLGRLLIGSVAEYVARHAHCTVLIVRIPASGRLSN